MTSIHFHNSLLLGIDSVVPIPVTGTTSVGIGPNLSHNASMLPECVELGSVVVRFRQVTVFMHALHKIFGSWLAGRWYASVTM